MAVLGVRGEGIEQTEKLGLALGWCGGIVHAVVLVSFHD